MMRVRDTLYDDSHHEQYIMSKFTGVKNGRCIRDRIRITRNRHCLGFMRVVA